MSMCFGWNNRPTCAATSDQTIVPPSSSTVTVGPGAAGQPAVQAGACPDITWFWIAAAAVAAGAVMKGGK
jgi:hypothetical protein